MNTNAHQLKAFIAKGEGLDIEFKNLLESTQPGCL